MPFIRFTQDRSTVEAQPQFFKAGRVYEVNEASCERWKRRKAAEDATEADFKAQAKATKKAAPAMQTSAPAPGGPTTD